MFIELMGTEFQPAIFVATPQVKAKILRFFPSSLKKTTTKGDWPPTVKVRVNFSYVLLKKKTKQKKQFSLSAMYTRVESRSEEFVNHSLEYSRATLFLPHDLVGFYFCGRD